MVEGKKELDRLFKRFPLNIENIIIGLIISLSFPFINFTYLSIIPLVILVFSPLDIPVKKMEVYRPDFQSFTRDIYNAFPVENRGRVIDSEIRINAGAIAALFSALYLFIQSPFESLAIFILTLIISYLTLKLIEGVGMVQIQTMFLVPFVFSVLLGKPLTGLSGGVPALLISETASLTHSDIKTRSSPVFSVGGRGSFETIFILAVLTVTITFLL